MTHNRRKRIYLNTPTQRSIILGFCLVPTITLIGGFVAIAYYCTRLTTEAMAAGVDLPSVAGLLTTTAVFVVIAGATTVFQAVAHSHRIAGPLVHILTFLREWAKGDRGERLHLRKNDYLRDLADELNQFLDTLQGEDGRTSVDAGDDESAAEQGELVAVESGQHEAVETDPTHEG